MWAIARALGAADRDAHRSSRLSHVELAFLTRASYPFTQYTTHRIHTMSALSMTMATRPAVRAAVAPKTSRATRAVTRATPRMDGGIYKEPHHGFSDEIINEVLADFPEAGIADSLEGMILLVAGGYTVLDVRADSEIDFMGNFPKTDQRFKVCSLINASRKYDSEKGEKVYVQSVNEGFKAQIEKMFPDKEARIIVSCSDGRNRAIQALEIMDEMGYVNIVGLKGGYNLWNRQWDSKLRRRNLPGVFKEEYQHGADTCGVHATGAGFENQDAFQYADWRDTVEWLEAAPVAA